MSKTPFDAYVRILTQYIPPDVLLEQKFGPLFGETIQENTYAEFTRLLTEYVPPEALTAYLDRVCAAFARYVDADALLRYKAAFPEHFQSFAEKE